MAVKPETRIVNKIMVYLRTVWNGDCYHVHGSLLQRKGEPDIDGSAYVEGNWLHLKLEVKTDNGEPSPLQVHRLKEYHKRGYVAGIVTSIEDVERLLYAYSDYFGEQSYKPFSEYLKRYNIVDRWNIWTLS